MAKVPVNISKIGASDSIQSHPSTMNSAKRLRNAPIGAHLRIPNRLTLPIAHRDTPTRPTRPSCLKFSIKYGILLYCFLSCVITSVRLYINLYGKKTVHDAVIPGNASLAHYLTRMLATSASSVTLEPFILSNMHPNSSVTLCAWATDLEFESLDKNWPHHWHGSVSSDHFISFIQYLNLCQDPYRY